MAHREDAPERPEFTAVDLDVPIDEAHREVDATIAGLHASQTEDVLKFRTADGTLVALLEKRPSGSGETMASLAYRTEPASAAGTRKARKIREALASHRIEK